MAASSTAVTVLTPNGRRQTVKVSSSTPLLQVLEDVCKKHGFNAEEFDLKFQRNIVDLSLQWRFSNLPNNAKLEMVTTNRQRSNAQQSTVRIALQLEDGSRLQDSFSCGDTLWELISRFPQTRVPEPPLSEWTPVCIYMRDEIVGVEALKKTTLKSLGLTGGNAIVRHVLKKSKFPEEGELMDTSATVATEKSEADASSEVEPSVELEATPQVRNPELSSGDATVKSIPFQSITESSSIPEPQQEVRPKIQHNHNQEEQPGPSGVDHAAASSVAKPTFIPFSGDGQRLGGQTAGDLKVSQAENSRLPLSPLSSGPPKAKKPKPSKELKHPASAKQGGWGDQVEEEFLQPVDREPMIYHLDSVAHRASVSEDLPDEFFEVTIDDVRKRLAQLKSERKILEEAPLMTKALREVQMKEKMERYPKVVVRIQFPDRLVLQGFFRPLETVGALKQFVRSNLEDPQLQFYLFIAPPKMILDDPTSTLFQANLFPAAVVYFGCDVVADYLQSDLLNTIVTAQDADEAIAGCMPRSPAQSSASAVPEEPRRLPLASDLPVNLPSSAENQSEADREVPKQEKTDPSKVPKWLKLSGKK